jgi:hypothetical protein
MLVFTILGAYGTVYSLIMGQVDNCLRSVVPSAVFVLLIVKCAYVLDMLDSGCVQKMCVAYATFTSVFGS